MKLKIEDGNVVKGQDCDITIKRADATHIKEIEILYQKRIAFNDYHHIHQWNKEEVTWCQLSKLYSIENVYIEIYKEKIVGCVCIVEEDSLYWPTHEKGQSLYLHKICTDPDFRGLHFADVMIEFFKEKGNVENFPYVCLDVRAHKTKLRAMYERHGFQLQEIIQVHPSFKTALYQFQYKNFTD